MFFVVLRLVIDIFATFSGHLHFILVILCSVLINILISNHSSSLKLTLEDQGVFSSLAPPIGGRCYTTVVKKTNLGLNAAHSQPHMWL